MQTIYIDILFFVNIFIDYFLLLCLKKFLNISVSFKRMILGCLVGGLFSLIALLPTVFPLLSLIITFATGSLLVFITFGKCNLKTFIKRTVSFFFINIGFCGIIILIHLLLKPSGLAISNGIAYFDISPVVLIIFTVISYFVLRIMQRISGKNEHKNLIYDVKVFFNDIEYSFKSKLDTGCNLKEPFSSSPVIIAEDSLFGKAFETTTEDMRIIPFSSMGGEGFLKGHKPQKLFINKKPFEKEIYIGICNNILKGEIKSLISEDVL